MGFLCRPAKADDYAAVASLKAQVHALHMDARPDYFRRIADPLPREMFDSWLEQGGKRLLLAEEGGIVLGYALLVDASVSADPVLVDLRRLVIEEICVDGRARAKGCGRALFSAAEDWARGQGYGRIELSVWSFNASASAFYEAMGMRPRLTRYEKPLGTS